MTRLENRFGAGLAVIIGVVAAAGFFVSTASGGDEPIRRGDTLVYPEGADISRALTEVERRFLKDYPLSAPVLRGDPPTGPIHCVAEYGPMEGILISWEGFTTIQKQMAEEITTTGDADLYVVVDSSGEQSSAYSSLSSYGIDMDRVRFVVRGTDTVWIRDYGPRYIYEGDCRAIVDHTYNRPRPNDNAFNGYFGTFKNQAVYEIPLIHGGGNFHLNALDEGNASALIVNENPSLTEAQIVQYWRDFQNLETTIWDPYPSYIDSTQHIDMWMQVVADDVIIISDWPYDSGSTQDQICDAATADFIARGWTVHRVPARHISYTHYTYTNMVVCNDLILLPYYTHSSVSPLNATALAAVEAACPDKTVVPVNCESIIGSAGAIHCIVMHVPEPANGENPSAYLKNYRGGESLEPGQNVKIKWISDDDVQVTAVDILLSINGGATFDHEVVAGTADDGLYTWTVPDIYTTKGRLRIVVHDADGNSGSDEGDGVFTILGTSVPGDIDGDGDVDVVDLLALLSDWGDCPDPPAECPADLDGSGGVDVLDLLILLSNWT